MWNQLVLWSPEYRRLFALAQVEPRLGENITRCRQLLLRGGVFIALIALSPLGLPTIGVLTFIPRGG